MSGKRLNNRPMKTATLLAQRIIAEITDRQIAPGLMLPPEREMLERYGVARGTLREALRYLEMQGVITMKPGPHGGPIVNAPDARPLGSVIALLLELSHSPFRTILEARELLEPAVARLAAERGDDEEIEKIGTVMLEMRDAVGDEKAFLDGNHRFHSAIGHASGNRLFELLLSSLAWISDATALGVDYSERRQRAVLEAHERIFDRIAARDPEVAAEEARKHIEEFARYLERHYRHVIETPLRWEKVKR